MEGRSDVVTEQPRMRPVEEREYLESPRGAGDHFVDVAVFVLGGLTALVLRALFADDTGLFSWTSFGIVVLGAGVAFSAHRVRRRRRA